MKCRNIICNWKVIGVIGAIIACISTLFGVFLYNKIDVKAETQVWIGDYYFLASALNESKVLDVSGGSTRDGANLQIYSKNGSDAQLFRIERSSNGFYKFINKGSGKAIDVAGAGSEKGTNVQIWQDNGTTAQQWAMYLANGWPDYYVVLINQNGMYLDVSGGNTQNGTNVQIWEGNGTASQVFKLIPYVQTTTEDVTLGDFNTVDEWEQEIKKAELSLVGYTSHGWNVCNGRAKNGKMITETQVLEYREIPVTYEYLGEKITDYIKLPSVIRYKLHTHEMKQFVWFDFTNLTLTQTCTCGKQTQIKWEVPYPVEDTVTKSY